MTGEPLVAFCVSVLGLVRIRAKKLRVDPHFTHSSTTSLGMRPWTSCSWSDKTTQKYSLGSDVKTYTQERASAYQLSRNSFAHPLELTLLQLFGLRGSIVVRAVRSGKVYVYEVVANPGCDFVYETFRIDKGGCSEAECGKPRSRTA